MERMSEHTGLISSFQLLITAACTNTGDKMKGSHPRAADRCPFVLRHSLSQVSSFMHLGMLWWVQLPERWRWMWHFRFGICKFQQTVTLIEGSGINPKIVITTNCRWYSNTSQIIGGMLLMCQNTTVWVYGAWIKRDCVLCSKTYYILHSCHNFPVGSRQAARAPVSEKRVSIRRPGRIITSKKNYKCK